MLDDRAEAFLASALAARHDRRHAFLAMAVLVVAFGITLPLADWRMATIPQFVPLYDMAIFVLDTLAAVLLYAQFEHLERRSLLGLGLAIARSLAELHRGTVEARSEGPGREATCQTRRRNGAAESRAAAELRSPRRAQVFTPESFVNDCGQCARY